MSHAATAALRERLFHLVEHLTHVLPGQGPLREFVHHNTLHGFQHLPFAEALVKAHALTGTRPYLPEAEFRKHLASGRITREDLAAALDDAGLPDLDVPGFAGIPRRQILLASLLAEEELSPAALDWRLAEEGVEDPALWQACREVAGVAGAPGGMPEIADFEWQADAAEWWEELLGRVGRQWTVRALLRHLSGEDVLDKVRTSLQRHLAAHLDSGLAAWHHADRGRGFYAAWRESARSDRGFDLDDLPQARDEIDQLADDPLAVIAEELPRLVADESLWSGYLECLALELPGWSGMILWRHRHPERDEGAPVNFLDYLAVRLVLERILCEDLISRMSGVPLAMDELAAYFAANPGEFYVRHALRSLALPEDLQHAAHALVHDGDWNATPDPAVWANLARAMAAWRLQAGRLCEVAWPLYGLLRHLPVPPEALVAAGLKSCRELLRQARLPEMTRGYLWLLAYERRYREEILAALAANRGRRAAVEHPSAQVVFCIDDREEGTRRHLEELAPTVETFGAAGFFGVPIFWQGIDDAAPAALCPVVVKPAHAVREVPAPDWKQRAEARAARRDERLAWRERILQGGRRASVLALPVVLGGAIPALAGLLASNLAPAWWGETRRRWSRQREGALLTRVAAEAVDVSTPPLPASPQAGFSDDEQADRVLAFLRGIGLTGVFAPVVALLGHGSASRNNPHQSAYDCGACSGRHGGPNARVFAHFANRPAVRRRLAAMGIYIPESTWFVGGEHNTCDDSITWFDADLVPAPQQVAFDQLAQQLSAACRAHAAERCRRFASAPLGLSDGQGKRHVAGRRDDPSQARAELGHATNAAAFVGRRAMSRGLFLDRRVFLVSYDPTQDGDGSLIEGILAAVGPVGAGINLEYYFSTVDNEGFGAGSKITHNLTGLFGVMEGTNSDLRTGLPRQMIEIHEAMRLLLVVEQTPEVLSAVVNRQPVLQELVGHAWLQVVACDPADGRLSRFCPARGWLPWSGSSSVPEVRRGADWYRGERGPLPPALLVEGAA